MNIIKKLIPQVVKKSIKKALYDVRRIIDKDFKNSLDSFLQTTDPDINKVNEYDKLFTTRLINEYQLMKTEQTNLLYKPSEIWERDIKERRRRYLDALKNRDADCLNTLLYSFRRNEGVAGITSDPHFIDIKEDNFRIKEYVWWVVTKYRELECLAGTNLLECYEESEIGKPAYIDYRGKRITFQLVRHLFYLHRIGTMWKKVDNDRPPDIVVELGAGFGGLCRLWKCFSPKSVYVIIDLPEVLLVASYFLKMNFPEKKIGFYTDISFEQVINKTLLKNYDIILLPNHLIEKIEDGCCDIFINIASLGEMDKNIVANYIKHIERICNGMFYTANRNIPLSNYGGVLEVGMDEYPVNYYLWEKLTDNTNGIDSYAGYREIVLKKRR